MLYSLPSMDDYDISPQVKKFWQLIPEFHSGDIRFFLEDFHSFSSDHFDVLVMIDVFEHVRDPFTFLELSRNFPDYFVFHTPLDLSAQSVLRGLSLIRTRSSVGGHLHSYTSELALETLVDCGYQIVDYHYSGDLIPLPCPSLRASIVSRFR